eukprot:COSAG01_NODE_47150_length_393_cov_0.758503_1_plen_59_part_10
MFNTSTAPAAPSGLASTSQNASSISLSWTALAAGAGDAVTAYKLYADTGVAGSSLSVVG